MASPPLARSFTLASIATASSSDDERNARNASRPLRTAAVVFHNRKPNQ
eukprot:CAMPEP_0179710188 /NCGR_PEP_ID=MMETSP0937-20121108/6305_1 /TAXON_ID=548131 ORGANISM="Ostreococcus mediterraneus, Strain clade-D-RCC2593" /NCGR_SAMPLE_ID=MMETSP0937 /ASSEMBLY_ACC=CAM_ASM_000575 /LENGTH=48 /DNA_ID= /DNA_START= /DNA_END= /DNA_ORIENTATION=